MDANRGDWKTLASQGKEAQRIIAGMVDSVVSMYLKTSSSRSRKPKAPPKATAAMMSRVRYWALRAKSRGLYSVGLEMYLVWMRLTSLARVSSMPCSREGFSLPAYCEIR
jgi:hypothetical protein